MSRIAKFVKEIVVKDPDTNGNVHLEVYKHEGGGMFAIDSSYLDGLSDHDERMDLSIPDPFATPDEPQILYLED
jgi:hypothetical protein